MGPNKRQLANGAFDHFFEGVKVRPQPLALRIPAGQNSSVLAKNGTHVFNQGVQPNQATNQAQAINQPQIASLPAPAVPVVLNSAQMPVSVGRVNAKITLQQQQQQQPASQNSSTPSTAQQQPGSPILTNLLHRGSPGPPEANNQVST